MDAAAIDSQVLAIALREEPELSERLRPIEALGPSTIQPVVAEASLRPQERRAIRDALVDLAGRADAGEVMAQGSWLGSCRWRMGTTTTCAPWTRRPVPQASSDRRISRNPPLGAQSSPPNDRHHMHEHARGDLPHVRGDQPR
ncbi:MAG: hypothetical protein H0W82_03635 [Actinobacteria bacterium]|nr:hypothetical protein [Actinomycetota bacterium]